MQRGLVWLIVLVPVFYYVALIGGSLTWPGYSHVTQYASELGSAAAPYPNLFNYNIVAGGIAAIAGGLGLFLALRQLSGRTVLPFLAGLTLTLWGAGMVMGGWFPMPDDRHGGYGLTIAGQLTPLFVLLSLRGGANTGALRALCAVIFVVSGTLFAIMMGVGGLVTYDNVGLWQRANSFFGIAWLAALGLLLLARLPREAAVERRLSDSVSVL